MNIHPFLETQSAAPFDGAAALILADRMEEEGDPPGALALRGLVAAGIPSLIALSMDAALVSVPSVPDAFSRRAGNGSGDGFRGRRRGGNGDGGGNGDVFVSLDIHERSFGSGNGDGNGPGYGDGRGDRDGGASENVAET